MVRGDAAVSRPLVLDIDASLHGLDNAIVADLADWQEAIRFGCPWSTWNRFRSRLSEQMPDDHGTVCMGSGDFHHISHLLLERLPEHAPFDVVVLDNHPDNMRFPFGIHCGSWVLHAARLPQVRCIHVLGISSPDVGWRHAWENHLIPIFRGKVRYWTLGVDTRWAKLPGLSKGFRSFTEARTLVASFVEALRENIPGAAYLSIDKDVFAPAVAHTNWDQGHFDLDNARQLIEALAGKLIGSDITGEVSVHHYQTPWKRWLSAVDEQPAVPVDTLAQWQAQQMAVNRQLLDWIESASQ
jgi:hypothetical protein